jgi:tetratricopeptide (TPR) repeat protein
MTPEEHGAVRGILERAVREAPDLAGCWAMLAMMYNVELVDEFNVRPIDRALAAAQRAVDLAPTYSLGHHALAFAYFFRKELLPFRAAVERAVALNPMDGSVLGLLGVLMHDSGKLEQGREIVEAAMKLNPNYPGLFRFLPSSDAYRQGK